LSSSAEHQPHAARLATAIVVADGRLGPHGAPTIVRRLAALPGPRLVVAADGGARHAVRLGLAVDVLVGDLDTLTRAEREALAEGGTRIERHPAAKDETDLELALLAARQQADRIVVLAALGGRADMTLANALLLADDRLAGAQVSLWEGHETLWAIRPPGGRVADAIAPDVPRAGDRLSLLPVGGNATGITTAGLAYALDGTTLAMGPARGVSNVLTAAGAAVALDGGLLVAVHAPRGHDDVGGRAT